MDCFAQSVVRRLALGQAWWMLLRFVIDGALLNQVFEQHRGRAYEKVLDFPTLVRLMADALLEHDGSGRQALERSKEDERLAVSVQAVYGKLRRMPLAVSEGWLHEATQRLSALWPTELSSPVPASLRALKVMIVDGKKIKHVAKRLKPARGVSGAALGGKVLVALSAHRGLAVAMHAHRDGETNDAPLLAGLLAQVREQTAGPILWVLDRQFCDLTQPPKLAKQGDAFLIRYHPKVHFELDLQAKTRHGTDAAGRTYREDFGHLGTPRGKTQRPYVRRITLLRPDHEEGDLVLITKLLDADVYPAADLLQMYHQRWSIENVFQQITTVFTLNRLIGSSLEATIFQCALCLLLYNIVRVLCAHVAAIQDQPLKQVSSQQVFYDTRRQLISMTTLLNREQLIQSVPTFADASSLCQALRQLLSDTWTDRWRETPTTRRSPPKHKQTIEGGHTSIQRLIDAEHKARAGHHAHK